MYLGSGSSFSASKGVLVQLEGLLLLIQLVEAVLVKELEVLQLGHLGQTGPAGPAAQHTTYCYRTEEKKRLRLLVFCCIIIIIYEKPRNIPGCPGTGQDW